MLKKLLEQGVKFGLVGLLNSAVDYIIYNLLMLIPFFAINFGITSAISYSCGVVNSLYFNRRFTFKDNERLTAGKTVKFIAVNLVSLGVSIGVIYAYRHYFGPNAMIEKLAAMPFSMVVNFTLNKLFVFKG